ncbi:MAG: 1,2-diacylglycerol 3-alpha-glucosyltransferase [Verrucomicrobiales bacterium]|jgi:1,2-diacylglycerol 3-alpha-glucosyltransferase
MHILTVAPVYDDMPEDEENVIRVPAVQKFNGSDFSVAYPLTGVLRRAVEDFRPDVIHSHHPFILGATAFRIARAYDTPLIFTHHTMYDQYTHYVPGDSPAMKRFANQLATSYANMCQSVIAPSESVRDILVKRGVTTPVSVVPTGVNSRKFAEGSGHGFRMIMGIPEDAFVVGHVGRLALEKNLGFLSEAMTEFLWQYPQARFLLIGGGPYNKQLVENFRRAGVAKRVHSPGNLSGRFLASAYRAMDVFAFASHSETQGMVLTEAMACGVTVVAVDAPGARETVRTGENGTLLSKDSIPEYVAALGSFASASPTDFERFRRSCLETADAFSIENSTRKLIDVYKSLRSESHTHEREDVNRWEWAMRMANAEWDYIREIADAAGDAIFETSESR